MYPRQEKLNSGKLKKLIEEKGILINTGRGISTEIEAIEKRMGEIDGEMKEIEKKVDVKEFSDEINELNDKMEVLIERTKQIDGNIQNKMKKEIPPELGDEYDELKNKKEKLENTRNRVALKAQKYNTRIIPITRKLILPLLKDEYEDCETIKVVDGELVCTIFSHLEYFKNRFKNKKNGIL